MAYVCHVGHCFCACCPPHTQVFYCLLALVLVFTWKAVVLHRVSAANTPSYVVRLDDSASQWAVNILPGYAVLLLGAVRSVEYNVPTMSTQNAYFATYGAMLRAVRAFCGRMRIMYGPWANYLFFLLYCINPPFTVITLVTLVVALTSITIHLWTGVAAAVNPQSPSRPLLLVWHHCCCASAAVTTWLAVHGPLHCWLQSYQVMTYLQILFLVVPYVYELSVVSSAIASAYDRSVERWLNLHQLGLFK